MTGYLYCSHRDRGCHHSPERTPFYLRTERSGLKSGLYLARAGFKSWAKSLLGPATGGCFMPWNTLKLKLLRQTPKD